MKIAGTPFRLYFASDNDEFYAAVPFSFNTIMRTWSACRFDFETYFFALRGLSFDEI